MAVESGGSRLGIVSGDEGKHLEVTALSEVIGGGRTEASKLGQHGGFELFSFSGKALHGNFPAPASFSRRVERHRSTEGCASYDLDVCPLSEVALAGR